MNGGQLQVGFDATSLTARRSGIGRYTLELLRALAGGEPDLELVLMAHRPLRPETAMGDARGLRRLRGPGFPSRTGWMQALLPVELAAARLDVCHFTNYHAPLLARGPMVVTLHDMSLLLAPAEHPARRVAAMRPLLRAVARRATVVVTPSESARADALAALDLDPDRVHVVPEAPAPVFRHCNDPGELARVAACHRLAPGFLLAIGTVEPRKNLLRLADAFASLRRDGFRQPLVICGAPGWGYGAFLARLRQPDLHGAVRLLGHVPDADLPALLGMAGAFAYPSLYEGFGLPVIEALACGTPTVTSDRGAMAEVAGDAALLVDPTDTADLARALASALGDPLVRDRLALAGPRRAAGFTWEAAARRTAAIYRAAAGRLA